MRAFRLASLLDAALIIIDAPAPIAPFERTIGKAANGGNATIR